MSSRRNLTSIRPSAPAVTLPIASASTPGQSANFTSLSSCGALPAGSTGRNRPLRFRSFTITAVILWLSLLSPANGTMLIGIWCSPAPMISIFKVACAEQTTLISTIQTHTRKLIDFLFGKKLIRAKFQMQIPEPVKQGRIRRQRQGLRFQDRPLHRAIVRTVTAAARQAQLGLQQLPARQYRHVKLCANLAGYARRRNNIAADLAADLGHIFVHHLADGCGLGPRRRLASRLLVLLLLLLLQPFGVRSLLRRQLLGGQ